MSSITGKGVGASLRRKEDARFLAGRGQFVGDIRRSGMLDVAFVRAPVAHARITSIEKPAGLKGFKPSNLWPLAKDKVRHVGETVAMCVGATRAEAEDIAAQVTVDYDELPAVVDMVEARIRPPAL